MGETILYEKEGTINLLEYFKNSCEISYVQSEKSTLKYGKFFFEKDEIIKDEDVKKFYSDKTKQLHLIKIKVKVVQSGDKISIRFYHNIFKRLVGSQYFKVNKEISFVTYNTKSKNFYHGHISKKRKKIISKKVRCNGFQLPFLTEIKLAVRRNFNHVVSKNKEWKDMISTTNNFNTVGDEIALQSIKIFINQLHKQTNILMEYTSNHLEGEMYKLYLKVNKVSYPDSVLEYRVLQLPKRELIKKGNLTQFFMDKNRLKGKKVRKILNQGRDIDFFILFEVFHNLGVDYFNKIRESFFSKNSVNIYSTWFNFVDFNRRSYFDLSNIDKKRIVNLINENKGMNWSIIKDHLHIIKSLKKYGEDFKMKFTNITQFNDEHYIISELVETYKKGKIKRIYNDHTLQVIEIPIEVLPNENYYPVVLTSSGEYNEESQVQSNCVRTYIEKPESLIISLRKNDILNKDRATVEYRILKSSLKRVQSRGKFNSNLDDTWNVPLEVLDNKIELLFNSNNFDLPKMIKEFSNGKVMKTKSYFHKNKKLNNSFDFLVWEDNIGNIDEFVDFDLPF
jgi:hypothetical protein